MPEFIEMRLSDVTVYEGRWISVAGDELVAMRVRRRQRSHGDLSATAGHVRRHRSASGLR